MKILIIDNYDSFTYNLYQYAGEAAGTEPLVYFNDKIDVEQVRSLEPDKIIISPGPGTPHKARDRGCCAEIVSSLCSSIPILGICMGHQIICYTFGAKIIRHSQIMHGKTSEVFFSDSPLFAGLDSPLTVMRYHSLVVSPASLPSCLTVTAELSDKTIMGVKHTDYPLYGLQFHPESIGTVKGKQIIKNFLTCTGNSL